MVVLAAAFRYAREVITIAMHRPTTVVGCLLPSTTVVTVVIAHQMPSQAVKAVAELPRRYHANQWTAAETSWLPAGAWQACVGEPRFEHVERQR